MGGEGTDKLACHPRIVKLALFRRRRWWWLSAGLFVFASHVFARRLARHSPSPLARASR